MINLSQLLKGHQVQFVFYSQICDKLTSYVVPLLVQSVFMRLCCWYGIYSIYTVVSWCFQALSFSSDLNLTTFTVIKYTSWCLCRFPTFILYESDGKWLGQRCLLSFCMVHSLCIGCSASLSQSCGRTDWHPPQSWGVICIYADVFLMAASVCHDPQPVSLVPSDQAPVSCLSSLIFPFVTWYLLWLPCSIHLCFSLGKYSSAHPLLVCHDQQVDVSWPSWSVCCYLSSQTLQLYCS